MQTCSRILPSGALSAAGPSCWMLDVGWPLAIAYDISDLALRLKDQALMRNSWSTLRAEGRVPITTAPRKAPQHFLTAFHFTIYSSGQPSLHKWPFPFHNCPSAPPAPPLCLWWCLSSTISSSRTPLLPQLSPTRYNTIHHLRFSLPFIFVTLHGLPLTTPPTVLSPPFISTPWPSSTSAQPPSWAVRSALLAYAYLRDGQPVPPPPSA